MENFTKKATTVAIIALALAGVMAPPASAQGQAWNEECYKGVWADTMGVAYDRVSKTIDPNTFAPHSTVEGITEYIKASLAVHPALSSYASGSTVHCSSQS
ncbi:hypothetical protein CMUST_15640 (plasmid) [Corynebacterium mustelae]|uniref:SLH domain-containing protein n=1 Tax=Corynebacterium mustelae TaxID=571915 RepID=A0A0G3H8D6_9CORY|nr:hypothetical protein [Corynebacterium mustelae]AKK07417.1 hypothetical protein CMUST_15640 [Corynebacterium mustelae]